ncbi:MAG: Rossmann fold domain-containing protein [Gemmobacter sp.]|uniref:Rossmann fold domain-containing protein n=1 Tax=Gemmobacter sp. TaxID=1898957 RepID=UPI00391D1629
MKALLTGQGDLADRVAGVLAAEGWLLTRAADAPSARLAGDETLLVTVAPDPAGDWGPALESVLLAPVRLAQALAAAQPDPSRDASGERRAPAQVVHVVHRRALVPGCADPVQAAATAALAAALREGALALAPRLRVNGLAVDQGADPAPALSWLLRAHAVTGQVLHLGPDPRPVTGWRREAGAADT